MMSDIKRLELLYAEKVCVWCGGVACRLCRSVNANAYPYVARSSVMHMMCNNTPYRLSQLPARR